MLTPCNGSRTSLIDRRAILRCGAGMAVAATALPVALNPQRVRADSNAADVVRGPAKSCIFVYLLGGPSQLDTFDLKPEAPAEIRGPFKPIATRASGLSICEHLPRLAEVAGRFALVRSVSYPNSNHTPMIYYTLTGHMTAQPLLDNDIRPPQPDDFPHIGSLLAKYRTGSAALPGFVAMPELAIRSSTEGQFKRTRSPLRGGGPGFLGARYAALPINDSPQGRGAVPALDLPDEVSPRRLARREALLALLDRAPRPGSERLSELRAQAIALSGTQQPGGARPFSLEDEPPTVRERYGEHRFGQCMLLARRLAEAGVPMVAIHFNEMTVCDGWDTHSDHFNACSKELLPMLDQSLSALIADLDTRGRLDETLVVCMGEFGRTPRINKDAGRDHWGPCSTALLAGGGVRGGMVLGRSDRHAAFPVESAIDPVDIHATIYRAMGVDLSTQLVDALGRPFPLCSGRPIEPLFV